MLLSLLHAALLLVTSADEKPARYPRAELLIEAAELAKPETAKQFRILDARGRSKYLEGHIPGAVHVDPLVWAKAFAAGQDPETWSRRIGELGIDRDTRVVVYDEESFRDAARIWWILRYWGIKDVRLLNGGWSAWQQSGGPVARDETKVQPTKPTLTAQSGRLATKEQMLAGVKDKNLQILDVRSYQEYCGETVTAKRSGAIPGAIHLEWIEAVDPRTKRFKNPEELARLFRQAGIDLNRPTATYCQSGGRAAVSAFVLELMGANDVRNYYRSWAEWGNADDTPIVKPPKK
jgi:thiosulfate/3-mercaptopyruvate sulfurtransferase